MLSVWFIEHLLGPNYLQIIVRGTKRAENESIRPNPSAGGGLMQVPVEFREHLFITLRYSC